jgi:hypothetical protein
LMQKSFNDTLGYNLYTTSVREPGLIAAG